MDQQLSGQPTPQLPRYRRLALRALPVSIQPRDLLLLKTIYEFPYSTAAQLSRLLPTGSINPQLRAYHDQRRLVCTGEDLHFERVGGVRREIRRRLQQLFHAVGGSYVQRHKIDNNSPILYTIAMRAVDVLAAEFDLDEAALARSARNRDPGEKFLRHARQRTNFRYAVTVAVDARPDIEIAYWLKDGSTKISITYKTYDGTIVEDTVIPDDILVSGGSRRESSSRSWQSLISAKTIHGYARNLLPMCISCGKSNTAPLRCLWHLTMWCAICAGPGRCDPHSWSTLLRASP
jgi:hypothetical protein